MLDQKKPDLTRNIKINVKKIVASKPKRTSTTLNYALCDFLLGKVQNPNIRAKMALRDAEGYRKWLETATQEWVNAQKQTTQHTIEVALAQEIYDAGVNNGTGGKLI